MSGSKTTERSETIDDIQSEEYGFPYHYIPSAGGSPMLRRSWGFADSYLAAINLVTNWLSERVASQGGSDHKHMDYGCGDGGFIFALNQLDLFEKVQFDGIDIDRRAIGWAELFSGEKQNVTFFCGDLLSLKENIYDSGTLIEVLEHIPPNAVPEFVSGIARSMKEGALLFVTVPSVEKPVSDKHYRHFDFETVQDCFKHDFDIVDCFGFEKRGRMSRWYRRLFMRKKRYLETAFMTKYLVTELQKKHQSLNKCGRIGLVVRKPARAR